MCGDLLWGLVRLQGLVRGWFSVVAGVCGCFVGCEWAGVAVEQGLGGGGIPVEGEGEGVLPVMGSDGLCVYVLVVWVHVEGVLC